MDEIIDSISTCPATEENIEILQRLGVAVNIIIDDNGREFVDGVGIPIGNYVSQYDGNFNLSVVDHWLKEVKGVKYYFRYMDDMVIFGSSKEELHKLKRELDEFMAVNLKQVLKHNWQVFPTKVKPLEIDDYHVYVNTGIKEIHEEVKEGDLSSGFDGFEIETQEIYEKDEYIQLMAEKNSSLEEQATDLQLALADVYEQMLGLSAN